MNRRSFLIGSGSILTTAFVEKADWFIRNRNAVVPLIKPEQATDKIYFVQQGTEYESRLGSPDFGVEDLTYREVLDRYRAVYLPKEDPVTLNQFRESIIIGGLFQECWIRKRALCTTLTSGVARIPAKQKHIGILMTWTYLD